MNEDLGHSGNQFPNLENLYFRFLIIHIKTKLPQQADRRSVFSLVRTGNNIIMYEVRESHGELCLTRVRSLVCTVELEEEHSSYLGIEAEENNIFLQVSKT